MVAMEARKALLCPHSDGGSQETLETHTLKKNQHLICSNVDGPGDRHAEGTRVETERQTPYWSVSSVVSESL